jgi:hypothetical protein
MAEPRKIPPNYDYLASKLKNIIEAGVFDLIIIITIWKLNKNFEFNLYAALVLIPVTVFCLMGINEQSVVTAFINLVKFKLNSRELKEPSADYLRKRDRAMLKKQRKQMKGR